MATKMGQNRPKKLVVLCDGTWCGKETNTTTNIALLAEMIGIDVKHNPAEPYTDEKRNVKARYFDGIGLGSTFHDYLFNGATGSDIGKECTDVYKYIVEHYTPDHEIWMFGLSRGSYTVRCVAGMINNCGIILRRGPGGAYDKGTDQLCGEVYKMYRSPYLEDKPGSEKMTLFRQKASHQIVTPIKFMGILDTVGSLGIPHLNAGVGLEYPEFHDQNVSSEVEKVYHAISVHDRLWAFQPCRALRDPKHADRKDLEIHNKWFPGCHYDVGRQEFKFLREGVNVVERTLFRIPSLLTKPVKPNEVLSALVLKWMLESIDAHDSLNTLIPNLNDKVSTLSLEIQNGELDTGSGDVYGNVIEYAPGGHIASVAQWLTGKAVSLTDGLLPSIKLGSAIQEFMGVKSISQILLAVRDRRFAEADADMYHFHEGDDEFGGKSIKDLAGLDEKRYPSRTFESFQYYLLAMGLIRPVDFAARTG